MCRRNPNTPEGRARDIIDRQLNDAGWNVIGRNDIVPLDYPYAVREELMQDNTESDYYLYVEDKAIALVEAKRKENPLTSEKVINEAEGYAISPRKDIPLWFEDCKIKVPFVFLANGKKILFKNLLESNPEYKEIDRFLTPKEILKKAEKKSTYGTLPALKSKGLRRCQYEAEVNLESSLKHGKRKALAYLTMGSGKTNLACLASYRLLNYTPVKRVLFLADRSNLVDQAIGALKSFNRTESKKNLGDIYVINKLKTAEDLNGDIVVSTIQKLYSVMTGNFVQDDEDVLSDETDDETNEDPTPVFLGGDIKISEDHFDFIIVDECHRSIYGKWKPVLDHFKNAIVLGLTATPTPGAVAYFNDNYIQKYTEREAELDGINVQKRIYRIVTKTTKHGGKIESGDPVKETSKETGEEEEKVFQNPAVYNPSELDHAVMDLDQIRTIVTAYRDAIYTDLYPDRVEDWRNIPKTLIFAKNETHATNIVNIVREVFSEKFDGAVPDKFVQKITYSVQDPNALIREFDTSKEFRIAVTVTLVSTGTDIRALDVVFFMANVKSDVLYRQMMGRGCRTIGDDQYNEVTPGNYSKGYYCVVDAVGVTEEGKTHPEIIGGEEKKHRPDLEHLLESLSHKNLQDENLIYLAEHCVSINSRYYNNDKFKSHLLQFTNDYNINLRNFAERIFDAVNAEQLPKFISNTKENTERLELVSCLIENPKARRALVELQKGYFLTTDNFKDEVIYVGFAKEDARTFIGSFETYLNKHKDDIEALRIIYNSEDAVISRNMLRSLEKALLTENMQFTPSNLWTSYKILDDDGNVDELDFKGKINALTKLIQLARFVYGKIETLVDLSSLRNSRFNLYLGQKQRPLTKDQVAVMTQIANYVINDGAINANELNGLDPDLWRNAMKSFGQNSQTLNLEMERMSKFILKAA